MSSRTDFNTLSLVLAGSPNHNSNDGDGGGVGNKLSESGAAMDGGLVYAWKSVLGKSELSSRVEVFLGGLGNLDIGVEPSDSVFLTKDDNGQDDIVVSLFCFEVDFPENLLLKISIISAESSVSAASSLGLERRNFVALLMETKLLSFLFVPC